MQGEADFDFEAALGAVGGDDGRFPVCHSFLAGVFVLQQNIPGTFIGWIFCFPCDWGQGKSNFQGIFLHHYDLCCSEHLHVLSGTVYHLG